MAELTGVSLLQFDQQCFVGCLRLGGEGLRERLERDYDSNELHSCPLYADLALHPGLPSQLVSPRPSLTACFTACNRSCEESPGCKANTDYRRYSRQLTAQSTVGMKAHAHRHHVTCTCRTRLREWLTSSF